MIKLYFKKLSAMVIYSVLCFIIYRVGFNLLFSVANIFKSLTADILILYGVPLSISALIVYIRRTRNDKTRRAYLKETESSTRSFIGEIKYMTAFSDFRAEMISFTTIFVILFIMSVINSQSPWYMYLFAMLITLVADALFIVVDLGLWMLVHRAWYNDEIR